MADNETGRFVWHELMTSDPSAAEPFYKQVVGWDTTPFEQSPTPYTMWMAGEQPVGGLMHIPDEAKEMGAPPNWLAYLAVSDVDQTVDKGGDGRSLRGRERQFRTGRSRPTRDRAARCRQNSRASSGRRAYHPRSPTPHI